MTTERSGMSLEQVRDEMRRAHTGPYTQGFHRWADAIDAHLATRDAVVSDEDVERMWELTGRSDVTRRKLRAAIESLASRKVAAPDVDTVIDMVMQYDAFNSLAGKGAKRCQERVKDELRQMLSGISILKLPDAISGPGIVMSKQDVRDAYYAEGWNACRQAMLAQRDRGTE